MLFQHSKTAASPAASRFHEAANFSIRGGQKFLAIMPPATVPVPPLEKLFKNA